MAQRRRLGLLALLGVAGEKGLSRDKLAGYLWPETDESNAKHLLSDSLYVLRKELGEDVLLSSGEFLRLNAEVVECDVRAFEAALGGKQFEEALSVYAGPFLDGFYLGGEGEFDAWVESERQRLAERYAKALEAAAEEAQAAGDAKRAVEWWKKLAAYDPFNSRVILRLMEALAAAGDPANALEVLRVHELRLRDELGLELPEDLRAFAERLRMEPLAGEKEVREAQQVASRTAPSVGVVPAREPLTPPGWRRWIHEMRRRSLWQVLLVYCGGALIAYEAVQALTEGLGLPGWFPGFAVVLFIILLPVVVATAMVQEGEPAVARDDARPMPEEVRAVGAEDITAARRTAKAREAAAVMDRRLRLLTWRNAGFGFVGALAVWGAVAAGWLLMGGRIEQRSVEATAIDPAHRIAVLPFTYRGDEEYAYLGEGMVDLLSYSLDGVGDVRTVTPRAVFSVLRQHGDSAVSPDSDASVTQKLQASRYVEGEIVESGGQLRISARLVPVDADRGTVTAAMVDGDVEEGIGNLVDDLSAQLLVGSEPGQLRQLGRVARMTTDSLAALKAFLEGVRSARVFQTLKAREALKRAVEIDSTFALAWWQLADVNLVENVSPKLTLEAAGHAVRYSQRLPWREQQLILASDAQIRGDFHAAERHYRAVTRAYPENVSAWLGLSLTYQYAHLHGRDREEFIEVSRQAYLHGAEYEPDWRQPPYYYWWDAVVAGDSALADSLLPKWTSREDMWPNARVLEAFCLGDQAAQDSVIAQAIDWGTAGLWLATDHHGFCEAGVWRGAEVARILAQRAQSGRVRAWAYLAAATYELALGHRRTARAEFEAARALERTWASQYETYWLLPKVFGVERGELEAARDSLLASEAPMISPLPAPDHSLLNWCTTVNDSIQPHIRLYLLGRLSARLGDYNAALRYADEVEALQTSLFHPSVSRDKTQAIRAFVLKEQGRYEEALAALEAAPRIIGYKTFLFSPFTRESQERYLRGELLAELGRHDEALRWLSTIGYEASETAMRAPARLLSAQIYERLGDVENAAVHYKRFIDLWRDCDPELRPWVEAARRALEALTPDT